MTQPVFHSYGDTYKPIEAMVDQNKEQVTQAGQGTEVRFVSSPQNHYNGC